MLSTVNMYGDGSDKHMGTSKMAAAAREDEAGSKQILVGAALRDCAQNGRLARAGHAVKPENAVATVVGAAFIS